MTRSLLSRFARVASFPVSYRSPAIRAPTTSTCSRAPGRRSPRSGPCGCRLPTRPPLRQRPSPARSPSGAGSLPARGDGTHQPARPGRGYDRRHGVRLDRRDPARSFHRARVAGQVRRCARTLPDYSNHAPGCAAVAPRKKNASASSNAELARVQEALRQSEASRRESQAFFERSFNGNPALMSIANAADGRILEVNPSLLRASGYTREENRRQEHRRNRHLGEQGAARGVFPPVSNT